MGKWELGMGKIWIEQQVTSINCTKKNEWDQTCQLNKVFIIITLLNSADNLMYSACDPFPVKNT